MSWKLHTAATFVNICPDGRLVTYNYIAIEKTAENGENGLKSDHFCWFIFSRVGTNCCRQPYWKAAIFLSWRLYWSTRLSTSSDGLVNRGTDSRSRLKKSGSIDLSFLYVMDLCGRIGRCKRRNDETARWSLISPTILLWAIMLSKDLVRKRSRMWPLMWVDSGTCW